MMETQPLHPSLTDRVVYETKQNNLRYRITKSGPGKYLASFGSLNAKKRPPLQEEACATRLAAFQWLDKWIEFHRNNQTPAGQGKKALHRAACEKRRKAKEAVCWESTATMS